MKSEPTLFQRLLIGHLVSFGFLGILGVALSLLGFTLSAPKSIALPLGFFIHLPHSNVSGLQGVVYSLIGLPIIAILFAIHAWVYTAIGLWLLSLVQRRTGIGVETSANKTSDGIRQPAHGSPKPSR